MNIIKHLNYLDVKWSSCFSSVLMVTRQLGARDTNKQSGAILAALRPFANTAGVLREGYNKRSQDDLHFDMTSQPHLYLCKASARSVSINQIRHVLLI